MAGTIANLELGPCVVELGTSGSEVDLGFTMGGVKITVATDVAEVVTDQLGKVIMKQIVVGRNAQIVIPFAETSLSLMSKIIPLASLITDATTATKQAVVLNVPVGSDLIASNAQSLVLTKAIGDVKSTNNNDRFQFFKASPSGKIEVEFSISKQRTWNVEFNAYPDSTQNFSIGLFGDNTAAA